MLWLSASITNGDVVQSEFCDCDCEFPGHIRL